MCGEEYWWGPAACALPTHELGLRTVQVNTDRYLLDTVNNHGPCTFLLSGLGRRYVILWVLDEVKPYDGVNILYLRSEHPTRVPSRAPSAPHYGLPPWPSHSGA